MPQAQVISFPTPAYNNNILIEAVYFQPSQFVISGITLGQQTTITTTANMNYNIGQQVRLHIPSSYGSYQLNEQTGYVLSIPNPNQVVISIDSSKNVNPFVAGSANAQPQITAIGDINQGVINSNGSQNLGKAVLGAFINISPL